MASEISICNMALGYLGQSPILNLLSPSTKVEEVCATYYATSRDSVLESAAWTFAAFRDVLDQPVTGSWGELKHPLKADWLTVLRVYRSVNASFAGGRVGSTPRQNPQADWQVIDGFIVTDLSLIYVTGTLRVIDPNKFPALVQRSIAAHLAAEMAIAITENASLHQKMLTLYEINLAEAMVSDGIQGRSEIINATQLVSARGRGG